MGETKNKTN